MILEPKRIKSLTVFIVSPSNCHEVMSKSVQSLSRFWLFETPWTTACQASLSINNSWSLSKLMSIESVMPSNHLILCHPFILLPSIFPSVRVFSNESALCIRWPKYWSFSFNISPSNEHPGLISFRILIKCETLVHSRSSSETPARKFDLYNFFKALESRISNLCLSS